MIQAITDIVLDVLKPDNRPVVYAKQGDLNSRYVSVSVTNDGRFVSIPLDAQVYINGVRSDKRRNSFEGEVTAEGELIFQLDPWLLQKDGKVECDVCIQQSGDSLSTMSFELIVLASACGQSDEEDDDNDTNSTQYEVASIEEIRAYLST